MAPPDHALQIQTLLRHREWVRGVARALVYGDQEAEDLEQEAWLAALRSPPPEGGSPRGWLATVLRRSAAKTRRRDEARRARELASAGERQPTSAADLVAQAELHEMVVRSVLALPEPYRTTVLRRFFEGLPLKEIATSEGVALETVRARLRRALALLRASVRGGESAAWPVALMPLAAAPAFEAGRVVTAGVLLMSFTKTAVLVAGAVVVSALLWFLLREGPPGSPEADAVPHGRSEGSSSEVPPVARGPGPAERIEPRAFDPRAESEPVAAASRASGPTGTIEVRVIWGEDLTPAANVRLHVVEWGAKAGMWKVRDPETGADGTVRLPAIAAGKVGFYVDRGGGETVDLVAGEEKTIVLEIPPAPTVAGVVVDSNGTPVAQAEVWLSQYGNQTEGIVVAKSDSQGEFKLRCVSAGRHLAARAKGHAPSPGSLIPEGKAGETVRTRLVLGVAGGALRGAVKRASGEPVSGATVRVTVPQVTAGAGWGGSPPPPIVTYTDHAGVFAVEGLPPGRNDVWIRIAGLAPWAGVAEIALDEPTRLEVVLERQAVIFGTIKTATGEPAAGAFVGVGGYGDFLSSMTTTGADGSYRLDSLAPGSIAIRASIRNGGKAGATLECAEGEEVRWDPVLDAGLRISGVVLDGEDRPLPGWTVNAKKTKHLHDWWGQAKTDASGRFTIANCPPDTTFRLEVWEKGRIGAEAVRGIVEDVSPGDGRMIRISAATLGIVKGRVLEADGQPVGVKVSMSSGSDEGNVEVENDPATGAFRIGPMLRGRWRITIARKPVGVLDLGEREIAGGGEVDLGDVKLPEPGRLTIDLAGAESAADRVTYEIGQELPNEPGGIRAWAMPYRAAHPDLPRPLPIAPGRYTLEVSGPRLAAQTQSFEVRSGQDLTLRVAAQPKEK